MNRQLIGDTIKITWINSGVTPTDINSAIYDGAGTLVHSATMTSSGAGHYYDFYTIPFSSSPQYYVAETLAVVNSNDYRNRKRFQTIASEVD